MIVNRCAPVFVYLYVNQNIQPALSSRIRAVVGYGLLALLITVLAGGIWTVLLVINLTTSPAIPWAVVVMAVLLWLFWQYMSGKGWPRGTSQARRRYLRATPLSGRVFVWALVAGLLAIVALVGYWIVLFQLVKVQGNKLPDFTQYPLLTLLLVLVMGSLVTSVAEEAAFRGYYQSVLEREVGGVAAVLIAALVIVPGHGLTQGFAWPTVLFYLLVDVTFGVMAYLTHSILPGLVVHFVGLLVFFTLVWPFDATRQLVNDGGADIWFWLHVAQAIIFTVLALLAFRQLARVASYQK